MTDFFRIGSIEDIMGRAGQFVIDVDGTDIHVNFKPSTQANCDTLLIGFHGSVDRVSRKVPAFITFLPRIDGASHQLCISDPSLRTGDNISMAWYAGDDAFRTQDQFRELFSSVAQALGVQRVIFFGTSGGGFAALYYSFFHENSIALVGNPQTRIEKFYERHVDAYLSTCWPRLQGIDALKRIACTDILELYASGPMKNTVIYLQNSTDDYHLFGHMAPFLDSIKSPEKRKRIVCECFFPGSIGHSPVWDMFSPWVNSAVVSSDWSAIGVLGTHFSLAHKSVGGSRPAVESDRQAIVGRTTSAEGLKLADLLRDYHLRQAKGT